jgi:hypothetical protein
MDNSSYANAPQQEEASQRDEQASPPQQTPPRNFPSSIPRLPSNSGSMARQLSSAEHKEKTNLRKKDEHFERMSDQTEGPYEWIDDPHEGWMAAKWDITHIIGLFAATWFFIVPGIIFLIWKILARVSYLQEKKYANERQNIAYERTGCIDIWSVLHLGSHPNLPLNKRILIGIKPPDIAFYDFRLNQLHVLPIASININLKTLQNIEGGSYVTTRNKMTVLWRENRNGRLIDAEFDLEPYNPKEFIQVINQISIS